MTSALITRGLLNVFVGITSYGICRGFNHPNPYEKAVLVTVLVGLRDLTGEAIKYLRHDKHGQKPLSRVLIVSSNLLTIPCALYAGRVFKFKEPDYLQIVGLAALGYAIVNGLSYLYVMFKGGKT